MKLTKAQTEALAELGLKILLSQLVVKQPNGEVRKEKAHKNTGRRWTKAQHAKFARTMRKVWAAKKQADK